MISDPALLFSQDKQSLKWRSDLPKCLVWMDSDRDLDHLAPPLPHQGAKYTVHLLALLSCTHRDIIVDQDFQRTPN